MKKIPFSTISTILIAGFIAVTLSSCSSKKEQSKTKNTKKVKVHTVTISKAEEQTLHLTEQFSVTLEANSSNNIVPLTGGRIKAIYAEVGDFVAKGAVLAKMDNSQLQRAEVQLADAKVAFARADELFKMGGVSKMQWEVRKNALSLAENAYANIQENTILRSPSKGVITKRNYDVGDICNPALPIFNVQDVETIKIKCNVSEKHFGKMKKGLPISLKVQALEDETFTGKITLVYPTLSQATHTFVVEAEFKNKNRLLRPGMFGYASLQLGTRKVLAVSDQSVLKQRGTSDFYLFRLVDGKAKRTIVKVGEHFGDKIEILEGIQMEDEVIAEGASIVADGEKVKIKQ